MFGYFNIENIRILNSYIQALLPDILEEAFPDKPNARSTPITLWRITVHPDKFVDARVSVILMKFLRARCALLNINTNPNVPANIFL